jgi:hypothetical protein
VDIEERFLPGEKFLKEYPALKVDRRGGWSAFLTNRRLFIGSRDELWDIDTSRIDYLSRGLRPRFSPAWLLLCLFPWLGWIAGLRGSQDGPASVRPGPGPSQGSSQGPP